VLYAIDYDKPILVENRKGGKSNRTQLDTYLGTFDVIKTAYDRHLLNEEDLCNSFSYYLQITNNNAEVRDHIIEQRKTDSAFFQAFSELVEITAKSKNPACQRTREASTKPTGKQEKPISPPRLTGQGRRELAKQ